MKFELLKKDGTLELLDLSQIKGVPEGKSLPIEIWDHFFAKITKMGNIPMISFEGKVHGG